MDTIEIEKKPHKLDIKSIVGYAVKWLVPLALTVLLVWYMFRKVNFADMWHLVTHGVAYGWILAAMGISVVSHIMRALRWRIQLRALDIRPPLMALTCSIFGTYALNLLFPRLGEVWRCTYIAKREHASFTKVVGSMVADRAADLITVASLTVLTFIVATKAITAFLVKYPVGRGIVDTVSNPWLWVGLVAAVVVVILIFRYGKNNKLVIKVKDLVLQMWQGFAVVTKMDGKWAFLGYTLAIWGCYFFQLYVAFFAFPFTAKLCGEASLAFGLVPCLVAFVLSSIGMAIPSNGGLGPWNIAVMFGLAIYGISDAQGTAFSMLQWSGQTVMLILLGIFTMVYIAVDKKK